MEKTSLKSCDDSAGAGTGATVEERSYINSLTELERRALVIAKDHLLHSFCIRKSNGYKKFMSDSAAAAAAAQSGK
jgi:alkaline phosphatase